MERLRIGITGISGRMGGTLAAFIEERDDILLTGATEMPGHPWLGKPVNQCVPASGPEVIIQSEPSKAFSSTDAIIDFTTPDATIANSAAAREHGSVHVIGTTGLTSNHLDELATAAREAVIVRAGNMSLGINLLAGLTERVAAALNEDFDIEVLESHHRYKVDSPSGTALMLGQAAMSGRGKAVPNAVPGFHVGNSGPRTRGSIGYAAVRGGDVVGEHDVIFAADGERIILRHIATDRKIYARGAIQAAIWGQDKPFGEYDMTDVLGLNSSQGSAH